ncbi:DedA family protein [Desulfotomaculum defluvii]
MTDQILDLLSSLGLTGLFAGVYLEALGLPFPGSVLVALTGFLCRQGEFNIFVAWLVSLTAYILGSVTAFMLGHFVGEPFLNKWGRYLQLTPERFAKAQELLNKSAPGFIIGGRFIPTVGNLTPYIAGISGIPLIKFLFYDVIHAVIWLTAFLVGGAILGHNWSRIIDIPGVKYFWVLGVVLVGAYLLKHYLPNMQRNRI